MGNPKHGADHHHEEKDVDFKGIMISAGGLFLTIVFGVAMSYATFVILEKMEKKHAKPVPAMAKQKIVPPEPHLQKAEWDDLKKFRSEDEKALNGYGWVDPKQGLVHIPIERAMELTAQRGLPYKEEKQS